MENKGQGALEYLLLIGGAVLVAVIVITLLLGITDTGTSSTGLSTVAALCKQQAELRSATTGTDPVCSTVTVAYEGNTYSCTGTTPNCTCNVLDTAAPFNCT